MLALVLAARFRRPWPIIAGILLATLLNHGLAAELGAWLSTLVSPHVLRWAFAVSFVAMGLWILMPDADEDAAAEFAYGAFLTTLISFFLVEIGDKVHMPSPLPRRSDWVHTSLSSPAVSAFPAMADGSTCASSFSLFEACSAFTRVRACTLSLSP